MKNHRQPFNLSERGGIPVPKLVNIFSNQRKKTEIEQERSQNERARAILLGHLRDC